jgi:phosphoglycerate dehydrogenase-like enzyme
MAFRRPVAAFNFANVWMQEMIRQVAPADFDVRFINDPHDEPRLIELLAEVDFLVTIQLPGSWVRRLKRCKLVQLQGVGYDAVDREALARAGIPLALTPEGTVNGVAEHTLLLILALSKRLTEVHDSVRRGRFDPVGWRAGCHCLQGKKLGIVGFGRIGQRVAHLARAFEAVTLYSDILRAPAAVEEQLAATRVPFEELLAEADIVSLHTPLTTETRGLFDAAAFAAMKPGALFINTSRGGTYDMDALGEALRHGHLGGAGLDVFNPQPPPPDHPILQLPNVVCTPHMATGTVEAHREKARAQFENFARVLRGEPPENLASAAQGPASRLAPLGTGRAVN